MPVIVEEDLLDPPPIPAKSSRRLTVNGGYGGHGSSSLLLVTLDGSSYLDSQENLPDREPGEFKEGIRDRQWAVRRGGWFRLAFWELLLLLESVVGLAVGLTVGLKRGYVRKTDVVLCRGSSADSHTALPPQEPPSPRRLSQVDRIHSPQLWPTSQRAVQPTHRLGGASPLLLTTRQPQICQLRSSPG